MALLLSHHATQNIKLSLFNNIFLRVIIITLMSQKCSWWLQYPLSHTNTDTQRWSYIHTATHSHTQPHTVIHSHTQPHTATHNHTQPHTATHSHTQPHTATHSHTQPHTATHSHTHKYLEINYLDLRSDFRKFPWHFSWCWELIEAVKI
jgi:hypothetical protein